MLLLWYGFGFNYFENKYFYSWSIISIAYFIPEENTELVGKINSKTAARIFRRVTINALNYDIKQNFNFVKRLILIYKEDVNIYIRFTLRTSNKLFDDFF